MHLINFANGLKPAPITVGVFVTSTTLAIFPHGVEIS
jgi:hypothetical protein